MKTDEMTSIIEGIIRDEATNPSARCTAIRTLRQIEQDREPADELHDELERIMARDEGNRSRIDHHPDLRPLHARDPDGCRFLLRGLRS